MKRLITVLLLLASAPILGGWLPAGLLSAEAFSQVRLVFNPTSLNFGTRPVASTLDMSLAVSDTSATDDIQVDGIQVVGTNASDFTVLTGVPFVVQHRASVPTQLQVRFSPQGAGLRTAQLSISTSDGTVQISVQGIGASESSKLALSDSTIDFGKLAPGDFRDTMLWLYSTGQDSASVSSLQVTNTEAAPVFQVWFANSTITTPFKLASKDSVAIVIRCMGGGDVGDVSGQLVVYGGSEVSPVCGLLGKVEYGVMDFQAPLLSTPLKDVDFGTILWGDYRDTVIRFVNTGEVDVTVSDLEPMQDIEFTILNPPVVPFRIRQGESYDFKIRASPAIGQVQRAQLQVGSPGSSPFFHYLNLFFTVDGSMPLSAPSTQSVEYDCGAPGLVDITLPVTDTGRNRFTVSAIQAGDSNIVVTTDVPLPRVIEIGETVPFALHFNVAGAIQSGKVVLQIKSGGGIVLYDTVVLVGRSTTASANIVLTQLSDSSRAAAAVRTNTSLTQLGLDTLVVHLSSSDQNVAAIDTSSIKLSADLGNARIISIIAEPGLPPSGGLAVKIASQTPIQASVGGSLVLFELKRFVAVGDLATIRVSLVAPDRAGCVEWTVDSIQIFGAGTCGAQFMTDLMTGTQIQFSAGVRSNPISGESVKLQFLANKEMDVAYELSNSLGEVILHGNAHVIQGSSSLSLRLAGIPSGQYFVRFRPGFGRPLSLRFCKEN